MHTILCRRLGVKFCTVGERAALALETRQVRVFRGRKVPAAAGDLRPCRRFPAPADLRDRGQHGLAAGPVQREDVGEVGGARLQRLAGNPDDRPRVDAAVHDAVQRGADVRLAMQHRPEGRHDAAVVGKDAGMQVEDPATGNRDGRFFEDASIAYGDDEVRIARVQLREAFGAVRRGESLCVYQDRRCLFVLQQTLRQFVVDRRECLQRIRYVFRYGLRAAQEHRVLVLGRAAHDAIQGIQTWQVVVAQQRDVHRRDTNTGARRAVRML